MATTAFIAATNQLRSDILRGRFRAGDRLKLADLARRYRTGQMPVREALRELQGERLVEMRPNCGARVRGVDIERVRNLFDVRIALETMLSRRAAERIALSDVDRLKAIARALERAVARRAYDTALVANRDFHHRIGTIAGNAEALAILDSHWRLIPVLWRVAGYVPERFRSVIDDHRRLLAALDAHDTDAAGTIATAHVARARNDLIERLTANAAGLLAR